MKRLSYCKLLIMGTILLVAMVPAAAQQDLTTYPMQSIPQSNYSNPALVPDCKIHIGCLPIIPLPVLSSIHAGFGNSGFSYDDVIRKSDEGGLIVDPDEMIASLNKKNYLTMNLNLELLSFGFKIKQKHYLSLGIYEKMGARLCYPGDLLSTIWKGNYQFTERPANLDGLGLDWNHYRELALGYSWCGSERWSMGGKLKALFGMSNIWTKRSEASFSIDDSYYYFTAQSGMHVNMAADEDMVNRITEFLSSSGGSSFNMSGYDPMGYLFNMKNMGGAIDLGFNYNINNHFSAAISVLDLGYIHWKTGARNFVSPDTTFVFQGFDLAEFIRKDPSESNEDVFKKIMDSLCSVYQLNETAESYWAPLNPVIFVSGFYSPSAKSRISLLSRLDIYKKNVHPSITVAYTHNFRKAAAFSVNYSYNNHDWLNVGFGGVFKMGPLQFFAATDNILAAIIPHKVKNINIHLGCNLVFYYKTNKPLSRVE